MDVRSFKNADIDRKNEEMNTEYSCGNCGHQFKDEADWSGNCDEHSCCYCECDCSECAPDCDDEPTMDCARCGHRGLTEGEVCIREWEGDSDAPMCAPCWDTTEQEEDEAFAMENIAELLGETPIVYEDPDKVSAEIVEEEEEREVFGKCDECGMEGKFFGKEGDDWTCAGCLCGNDNGTDDSDDEREQLVCPYCGRDERCCEANADKDNGNPITDWCGEWGLSCDECYYRWNADTEDEDEDDEEETEADKLKSSIKHLLADLNRLEGADGVEKFLGEVLRKPQEYKKFYATCGDQPPIN
jgi:hypothetical protein